MGIDKPSGKNLLYCPPHLTVAGSGLDFQEGHSRPAKFAELSSHSRQLNAGDDA